MKTLPLIASVSRKALSSKWDEKISTKRAKWVKQSVTWVLMTAVNMPGAFLTSIPVSG